MISVVMANYRGAAHIRQALQSVGAQTIRNIEIVVSDDASPDDSVALVRAAMADDPRIRLVESAENRGPAATRNAALELARGEWIAVVDSDDLLHPERFERLLEAAVSLSADVVADDLMCFSADGLPATCLLGDGDIDAFRVQPADWIVAGERGGPALGYLKPMIRASVLGRLRYDESLRIGEDFDLVLRLLLAGASFQVVPEPWYLYRRHAGSISHRLSVAVLDAMLGAQRRLIEAQGPFDPSVTAALARRERRLSRALDYERLVAALKQSGARDAFDALVRRPELFGRLAKSATERAGRQLRAISDRTAAQGRPASGRTLHLTGSSAAPAARLAQDMIVERVPSYAAPQAAVWGRAEHRRLWQRLAGLAGGGALDVSWDGPGGEYAAGFIPATPTSQAVPARAHGVPPQAAGHHAGDASLRLGGVR